MVPDPQAVNRATDISQAQVAIDREVRETGIQLREQSVKVKIGQRWNIKRHSFQKKFQTIFGFCMILTMIFMQFLIVFGEQMNSARMVVQTLLIIIESLLLYITLIGISGIQFKNTSFNKVILLTTFNDK
jgi:hypothetical protein